jgi:hypothetical protein
MNDSILAHFARSAVAGEMVCGNYFCGHYAALGVIALVLRIYFPWKGMFIFGQTQTVRCSVFSAGEGLRCMCLRICSWP